MGVKFGMAESTKGRLLRTIFHPIAAGVGVGALKTEHFTVFSICKRLSGRGGISLRRFLRNF